jgi:sugar phosphate isomerase/epimerase
MQFGICTSVANWPAVKAAGWDFIEENVQSFLQAQRPDAEFEGGHWDGNRVAAASGAVVAAANCLVPAELKITGPQANPDVLQRYFSTVVARAKKAGIQTLVFGSGAARKVPDGWDRDRASKQILDFSRMAAGLAGDAGLIVVIEHLNSGECNIINSVAEAMTYVRQIDRPSFQCLVDSYHFWLEKEKLDDLKAALPHVRHVHVADLEGRLAPGQSGKSDYRPFFACLKAGGYNGRICVEALGFSDIAAVAPRVLAYIKEQWAKA